MKEDFKSQVERRLEELFHDDGESIEPLKIPGELGEHPLKDLKAILLSIEWEITDGSMESLMKELESLQSFYRGDKLILNFLRLIRPVARYIKVRKGKSHPNATALLSSVYSSLEQVALSKEMSRKEKEKILLQEVEKFKKLKEEVIRRGEGKKEEPQEDRVGPSSEGVAYAAQGRAPAFENMTSQEIVLHALEEIKELIRAEFRALRAEVQLWRDSR